MGKQVVTVVGASIQEFLGERYYLCGRYFQRKGRRLHVVVWEHTHGRRVPEGFNVHHADRDRSNNDPGNLELLAEGKHGSLHMAGRKKHIRRIWALAKEAARLWHGSAAGRKWHRRQYDEHCRAALTVREKRICGFCGTSFSGSKWKAKFCSNKCKAASRRRAGIDNETRTCVVCGREFIVGKYLPNRTCGRSCGGKLARRKD